MRSFSEIFTRAKAKSQRARLAVAGAASKEVLEALVEAYQMGFVEPVLLGEEKAIREIAKELNLDLSGVEVIDQPDLNMTAKQAVGLVKEGKAGMLMKGKVDSSTMLKAVLDKETGLRGSGLITHVAVVEMPTYDRLMFMTDGGTIPYPNLQEKIGMIQNAITLASALGIENPNIALLSAVETVSEKIPETLDYALICKMFDRGQLKGGVCDGPVAMDLALSAAAAKLKKIDTPIAGKTDIFLFPNIACCNIFVKGLIYLTEAKVAGIMVGGGVPIVLLSRADSAEIKLNSIALACAM
jgi:phosphate butyryltransferase